MTAHVIKFPNAKQPPAPATSFRMALIALKILGKCKQVSEALIVIQNWVDAALISEDDAQALHEFYGLEARR